MDQHMVGFRKKVTAGASIVYCIVTPSATIKLERVDEHNMVANYDQTDSWRRETGEIFGSRVYADETVTAFIRPHEATNEYDAAINLSMDTWREIRAHADDADEITVEESRHETVTATFDGEWIEVSSDYVSDSVRFTREELDNLLDHARQTRKAFEYDGIV